MDSHPAPPEPSATALRPGTLNPDPLTWVTPTVIRSPGRATARQGDGSAGGEERARVEQTPGRRRHTSAPGTVLSPEREFEAAFSASALRNRMPADFGLTPGGTLTDRRAAGFGGRALAYSTANMSAAVGWESDEESDEVASGAENTPPRMSEQQRGKRRAGRLSLL
ncbi:hypothetical protein B0H17DRAFT_1050253 [Mycena rosella]|uniref:Uncharacterized protein n=1 Tax=Mycena rosella TaxID=1033263 RepID=A0AAD7DV92_MYCRO|nr:hypothetical protein B0H17DRAFT_1050253 [Mycena rosella]